MKLCSKLLYGLLAILGIPIFLFGIYNLLTFLPFWDAMFIVFLAIIFGILLYYDVKFSTKEDVQDRKLQAKFLAKYKKYGKI